MQNECSRIYSCELFNPEHACLVPFSVRQIVFFGFVSNSSEPWTTGLELHCASALLRLEKCRGETSEHCPPVWAVMAGAGTLRGSQSETGGTVLVLLWPNAWDRKILFQMRANLLPDKSYSPPSFLPGPSTKDLYLCGGSFVHFIFCCVLFSRRVGELTAHPCQYGAVTQLLLQTCVRHRRPAFRWGGCRNGGDDVRDFVAELAQVRNSSAGRKTSLK